MSFYIDFSPLLLHSPGRLLKVNLKEQSSALAGNPRTAGIAGRRQRTPYGNRWQFSHPPLSRPSYSGNDKCYKVRQGDSVGFLLKTD